MNSERDKFLTEVIGECWHERSGAYIDRREYYICKHCGTSLSLYPENCNNFSTWEGFGKLWVWSQNQEWWLVFIGEFYETKNCGDYHSESFCYDIINPDCFANVLYQFLKEK